jgi:hypothetical protein
LRLCHHTWLTVPEQEEIGIGAKSASEGYVMSGLGEQIVTTIVISIVSVVVGWMFSSLRMTTRAEFARQVADINARLDQIESEQKTFVTRTEFRDTMRDLKESLEKQHDQLRDQLNQINATLLTRRGTTQDK